ncbi:hypothetical protein L226DRAFT_355148 [Lentinus tigrinus ALCF2SS1-7]|uniref:uncharacterized protein n=1 Tax=Lentinus tigrinus ALCF2SS1-7 TaxID=1328758 RepID=UPI001165E806|nr:hypothetical protein L226DRAFT_355148 [Lentinus tigrinus ALCF2SS1-7]
MAQALQPPMFDIILNMMSLMPSSMSDEFTSLMQTCRLLYREGGKQFLQSQECVFLSADMLPSFCQYMLADNGSRQPFLKDTLCFEGTYDEVDKRTAETLVHIVSRLTNLRRLEMAESCLFAFPGLGGAIASLTSLEEIELRLRDQSIHVEQMLLRTQSQLTSADIVFDGPPSRRSRPPSPVVSANPPDYATDCDPILLLVNSRGSLEELVVNRWTITREPYDVIYPKLTHLDITNEYPSNVFYPFIYAFPNLEELQVKYWRLGGVSPSEEAPEVQEFRYLNGSAQFERGSWKMLGSVSGTVLEIYSLGLICPVGTMNIEPSNHYYVTEEIALLSSVLEDTEPKCLFIAFTDLEHAKDYLVQLQALPGGRHICSMEVSISVTQAQCARLTKYYIHELLESIPTSVTELELRFFLDCDCRSEDVRRCSMRKDSLFVTTHLGQDNIDAAWKHHGTSLK